MDPDRDDPGDREHHPQPQQAPSKVHRRAPVSTKSTSCEQPPVPVEDRGIGAVAAGLLDEASSTWWPQFLHHTISRCPRGRIFVVRSVDRMAAIGASFP